jgi:hypothetical protein
MMHDIRVLDPRDPLLTESSFEVKGAAVAAFTPNRGSVLSEEGEVTGDKSRFYGYEGFISLGVIGVFPKSWKTRGNFRVSAGTYTYLTNQLHSHEPGKADAEIFEPHRGQDTEGRFVTEVDFGKSSSFAAVPLLQTDLKMDFTEWKGLQRKFLAWLGTYPQGVNVWNTATVSAKPDAVFFNTLHTPFGIGTAFYLGNANWDFHWGLSYRHAEDGDLVLAEQKTSFRFLNHWRFRAMLYGGVKHQTPFEDEHHEEEGPEEKPEIEKKLGLMLACGGSFSFEIPLRRLRLQTGAAAGSLHAIKDQGLDPVSGLFEAMPRRHFLVRPYALASLPLPVGELSLGLSWYSAQQSYVTDPGDAAVVKRANSFEARLALTTEVLKRRHHVDLTFFAAYLHDSQRFYQPTGTLFSKKDNWLVLGLQIFYGGTVPLSRRKTKVH